MESGVYTNFKPLGGNNFRIFITKDGVTFSIDVPCNGYPTPEAIIDFFNKKGKEFVIEV